MKITKRQLRRIIRESNLREQAEDRIKFRALFKWPDDDAGSINQSWEEVSVWAEELEDYEADTPIELAMAWAHDNLDGAPSLEDVLMHQEDTARVSAWMAGGSPATAPATAKDTQSSQEKADAGEIDYGDDEDDDTRAEYESAHSHGWWDAKRGKPQSPEGLANFGSSHYKRGYEQGAAGRPRKFREGREMRISKRQLRRIIRESILREQAGGRTLKYTEIYPGEDEVQGWETMTVPAGYEDVPDDDLVAELFADGAIDSDVSAPSFDYEISTGTNSGTAGGYVDDSDDVAGYFSNSGGLHKTMAFQRAAEEFPGDADGIIMRLKSWDFEDVDGGQTLEDAVRSAVK